MQPPARIPAALTQRMRVEVRARAALRHRANMASWAASDAGPIPTLEEATAEELAATEVLLRALGELAVHAPDEVFPPEPWDPFASWVDDP
jgi:hypothetical protein